MPPNFSALITQQLQAQLQSVHSFLMYPLALSPYLLQCHKHVLREALDVSAALSSRFSAFS